MSRRSRKSAQGFTLLEVMMAVLVMLIGVMGIVSMQRATYGANADARTTATATFNTSRWVGILHRSAQLWTDGSNVTGVPYLENVGTGWFIPPVGAADDYGVDWYGTPTQTAADVRFCTLIQLQWLTTNSSMRADVMTFWATQSRGGSQGGADEFTTLCDPGNAAGAATALNADTPTATIAGTRMRMVRTSTVVRRVQP